MKSEETIRVLLYKHPFKSDRELLELERKSFRKLYEELELEFPIENYIILDGDEIVKDYTQAPKSENVYIKCVPEGDGGGMFAKEGNAMKIGGGIAVVLGVALAIFTGGATLALVGIGLAISGAVSVGYGIILYNYELDSDGYSNFSDDISQAPSIRGGSNAFNNNGKIPVLLGRHLILPFYVQKATTWATESSSVTPNLSTKTQYLESYFCSGYSKMEIDSDTYQIGDVNYSEYGGVPPVPYETGFPSNIKRIKEEYVGVKIDRLDEDDAVKEGIVRTTAIHTDQIRVSILFPTGVVKYNSDGDPQSASVSFKCEYKSVQEADTAYKVFGNNSGSVSRLSGNAEQTIRFSAFKDLDNTYPYSTDYNEGRQYSVRVTRISLDDSERGDNATFDVSDTSAVSRSIVGDIKAADTSTYNTGFYFETLKAYTATFDDAGNVDTSIVDESIQDDVNLVYLKTQATDQLKDTISTFNYEATAYSRVYSGTGMGQAEWTEAITSNPASAFLKVLTDPHINKDYLDSTKEVSRIDWESLEDWYTFCEDKGFECNVYLSGAMTINSLLNNIVSVGRASWNIVDGKYTIKIDTYDSNVIQYFTPRNTKEFSGAKTFNETPTVLAINFIDKDNGYTESVRNVFYDDRTNEDYVLDSDISSEVTMFGAMGAEQVWKLGKYMHAVTRLRPEIYTFTTDLEHLMCTRGDRIKLSHDVPLFGLSTGRVMNTIEDGGLINSIILDEYCQFENGKDYGITIRLQDGSSVILNVINPELDSQTVILETPTSANISIDDLVMFGERGMETVDLIVSKIEPSDDMGAKLTCLPYDEQIFVADAGVIPVYDPKISKGGGGALNIGETTQSNQDLVNESNTIVQITDQIDYRLTATLPDSTQISTDSGIYMEGFDQYYILYANSSNSNHMYKKTKAGSDNGVAINSASTGAMRRYEYEIFYINNSDGGKLWKKNVDDALNGSAITSNAVYDFDVDDSTGDIYYINSSDNYLYKIDYEATGNGTLFYDEFMYDVEIDTSEGFFYTDANNYIVTVEDVDTKLESMFYNAEEVDGIRQSDLVVYYLKSTDSVVYGKNVGVLTPSEDGTPRQGVASAFTVNGYGDVIFSSASDGDVLFYAPTISTIRNSSLDAVETAYSFTADVTEGSTALTGLSVATLDSVVKNDILIADGLDVNTRIVLVGNTFVYYDKPALETVAGSEVVVSGTRINLNANKVIVPGTIDAELLSASAINSKARADDQNFISEIDLDTGTQKFRKQDGTVVLDFDPNRTGSELTLSGNISLNSGSTGTDGNAVPTATEVSAISTIADDALEIADGEIVSFYQTSAPSGQNEKFGDIWIDTDKSVPLIASAIFRYQDTSGGSSGTLSWVNAPDNAIGKVYLDAYNADLSAVLAQSTADTKILTFYQTGEPTASAVGDIWVDTDDGNKMYRWSGSAWVDVQDTAIGTAQGTADGKITTFYQTGEPTAEEGDIWVDTDNNNLQLINTPGTPAVVGKYPADWSPIQSAGVSNVSDTANRKLSIGEDGLLVLDSVDKVLHDLPTAPLVGDMRYMGHLYRLNNVTGYSLYYDGNFNDTLQHTVQADLLGNSIIRGVELEVEWHVALDSPASNILNFWSADLSESSGRVSILRDRWQTGASGYITLKNLQLLTVPVSPAGEFIFQMKITPPGSGILHISQIGVWL